MNEKIRIRITEAKEELEMAEAFFVEGKYSEFIFYSQQVIESSLKALYMFRFIENFEKFSKNKFENHDSHSNLSKEIARGDSVGLAQRMKIKNELILEMKELGPEYLFMKYPNIKQGIPKEFAEMHRDTAKKVLDLVSEEIKFESWGNENIEMESEIEVKNDK